MIVEMPKLGVGVPGASEDRMVLEGNGGSVLVEQSSATIVA